jgi:hypothetical protein
MAERYWPGENPLGKNLIADGAGWREIVGVVGNVKRFALEDRPKPELYMPTLQPGGSIMKAIKEIEAASRASAKGGEANGGSFSFTRNPSRYISLTVRTSVRPETVADAVRKTV